MTALREAGLLSVDVADLIRSPGSSKDVHLEAEVEQIRLPMSGTTGAPVELWLRLDSIVEGIFVSGRVVAPVRLSCRRCLTEVVSDLTIQVDEVFSFSPDPGDEDAYRIEDERIDLEPMVRDALGLALPADPLCKPDCAGLCPVCGEDRNETDCGHDATPTDVRWEPLRDMLDDKNGMEE